MIYIKIPREYKESNYAVLSDEYEAKFINSINSDSFKFKYTGLDVNETGGYKNLPYNTFIIHYEDGTKSILDRQYVSKYDVDGNRYYREALAPYECDINCSLFLDFPKSTDDCEYKDFLYCFVSDSAFFKMKKVKINDPNLKEGETFYRYYKLINDCITSDYHDIKYNKDGEIIYCACRANIINGLEVLPITQEGYEYDTTDETIKSVDKMVVYIVQKNQGDDDYKVYPIEVNYINREKDDRQWQTTVCIDLTTGEEVDYPDFIIK